MTDEAGFKAQTVEAIRKLAPNALAIRHEDKVTTGIPDLSLSYAGITTWWEFKVIRVGDGPEPFSPRVQVVTALRLDRAGSLCRYIAWRLDADDKPSEAVVLDPRDVWIHLVEGRSLSIESSLSPEPSAVATAIVELHLSAKRKINVKIMTA
jgi:hypothetical protein